MLTITPAHRTLASELGLFLVRQPLTDEDCLAAQRPDAVRSPQIWLVRCAFTKRPIGRLRFTEVDCLYVTKYAANISRLEEAVAGALHWIAPLIRHVRTGQYAGTEVIVPRFRSMHVRPRPLTECGARSTSADYDPTDAQSELINGQSHEMCPACRAKLEERGAREFSTLPAGSSVEPSAGSRATPLTKNSPPTLRQQTYIRRLLEEGERNGRLHLVEEQNIHQLSGREASTIINRLKALKERSWKGEL
jgi:hypothetical protein